MNPISRIQGDMALLIAEPEVLNESFVAVATWPTAAIQTPAIRETITAYSTAVGPSSSIKNLFSRVTKIWYIVGISES